MLNIGHSAGSCNWGQNNPGPRGTLGLANGGGEHKKGKSSFSAIIHSKENLSPIFSKFS
jgi:hypothetical protein